MRHVVLRLNGLTTEFLHESDGAFVWSDQQLGRADFTPQEARELAQQHGGYAVPVMTEPPKRKPTILPEPPDAPIVLPTHPPDGWATRWESEHEL